MKDKCFLDMDGVIADFMGSLCRVHNRQSPYLDPKNLGIWETEKLWGISERDFWVPIAENSLAFWAGIEKTPEADQLVDLVSREFGEENVAILTAPSSDIGSVHGKRLWLDKYYPQFKKRVIFASCKEFLAGKGKYLVDDRDRNLDRFKKAGGIGIMVPRPWNSGHTIRGLCVSSVRNDLYDARSLGEGI